MYPFPDKAWPAPALVTAKAKMVNTKSRRMSTNMTNRYSHKRHDTRHHAPNTPANDTKRINTPMIMTGHCRKRTHTVLCCLASQMPAPMIGIDNTNVTKFKIPDNKLLKPITPNRKKKTDALVCCRPFFTHSCCFFSRRIFSRLCIFLERASCSSKLVPKLGFQNDEYITKNANASLRNQNGDVETVERNSTQRGKLARAVELCAMVGSGARGGRYTHGLQEGGGEKSSGSTCMQGKRRLFSRLLRRLTLLPPSRACCKRVVVSCAQRIKGRCSLVEVSKSRS